MDEFEKFLNKALRFLSYRPRSQKEVEENLKKAKAPPLVTESIIKKLKEYKFINDKEFAAWWLDQRTKFKPRAWRMIKHELKRKGVQEEIIEELRFKIENDIDVARILARKRYQRLKNLPREEVFRKLSSFLARRGFSYSTIKESIDEIIGKNV